MTSNAPASARPYPNVREFKFKPGHWEARLPSNGTHKHLGIFKTAEDARRAVLLAQAERLEAKAFAYRAEANALVATDE